MTDDRRIFKPYEIGSVDYEIELAVHGDVFISAPGLVDLASTPLRKRKRRARSVRRSDRRWLRMVERHMRKRRSYVIPIPTDYFMLFRNYYGLK